jgi:thiol-disulfide isomerase/thioredoxin
MKRMKWIAATWIIITVTVAAKAQQTTKTKAEQQAMELQKQLGLSDEQTAKATVIYQNCINEMANQQKAMQDSLANWKATHITKAIMDYAWKLTVFPKSKIDAILTDEQKKNYDAAFVQSRGLFLTADTLPWDNVGSIPADFTVATDKGDSVSLHQFKGKYLLVDFWASWCGPCKASFPFMKRLYEKYKSGSLETLGISIDKNKEAWLTELKKQDLPWLQGWNQAGNILSSFGSTGIPATYLIDPKGKIIASQIGMNDTQDNAILKKLVELFGDKGVTSDPPPPPPHQKTPAEQAQDLQKQLSLSASQTAKITRILQDENNKFINDKPAQDSLKSWSAAKNQKALLGFTLKELDIVAKRVRRILTDDQKKKYDAIFAPTRAYIQKMTGPQQSFQPTNVQHQ